MKLKEYLINLWDKIKYEESGESTWWSNISGITGAPSTKKKKTTVSPTASSPYYTYGSEYYKPRITSQKAIAKTDTTGDAYGNYSNQFPAFEYPSYESSFDWKSMMPGLPQAPVVTQQMIQDWLKRSTEEAGIMYDPQLLAIQQELQKALLSGEQAKGGIAPEYQKIIENIAKWKEEELGAEQRRWYARGLGRGGGLIEEERKIGETALKETTSAETEKARKMAEIEEQGSLLKQQAGEQETALETERGRYIATRQAELRDNYETNQREIEQARFANQMQMAQFGITAQAQEYDRYLQQAQMANEQWYQQQSLTLEYESMVRGTAATSGMSEYQKATVGGSQASLAENARQFDLNYQLALKELEQSGVKDPTQVLNDIYASKELKNMGYASTGEPWFSTYPGTLGSGSSISSSQQSAWQKYLDQLSNPERWGR